MAGASLDDIFVIILFTSFITLRQGQAINISLFTSLPISIITGLGFGFIIGYLLVQLFKVLHMRDTIKVLLLLSISFLLLGLEKNISAVIPFSALLAVMAIGMSVLQFYPILAHRITSKFSKIWVASEVFLFILVGAVVDLSSLQSYVWLIVFVLFLGLISRFLGVQTCLVKSKLTPKERLFTGIAYIPKATVQAAIGSIPLALGFSSGNIILSSAVLSILITAPLGAIGIDLLTSKLLDKDK
jgi:NhaP-type Na+/H+ or K+/H+ antiporter